MIGGHIARREQPHWLYRLFDQDGNLLYVGQTCNPVQRFQHWHSRRNLERYAWFRQAVRVDWRRYPDWYAVTEAEKKAIESEAPRHNIYHRPALVA